MSNLEHYRAQRAARRRSRLVWTGAVLAFVLIVVTVVAVRDHRERAASECRVDRLVADMIDGDPRDC